MHSTEIFIWSKYLLSSFLSLSFLDDTYMYDDAARGSMRPHQMGHWYDEPPYESDPDDFLMSGINSGPAAIIQVHICCSLWYPIANAFLS